MNHEETAFYLSEAYKMGLYKTLFLNGSAGFLGGVINGAVSNYLSRMRSGQTAEFKDSVKGYLLYGLLFGFLASVIVYSFFVSYLIESMTTIKTINQFSIPIAILYPSVQTVASEVINNVLFRRNSEQ
jgi:fructose-specific phosphotransferase system IIC component